MELPIPKLEKLQKKRSFTKISIGNFPSSKKKKSYSEKMSYISQKNVHHTFWDNC